MAQKNSLRNGCCDSPAVAMTLGCYYDSLHESPACLGQILVYLETTPFTTGVQYKGLGIAGLSELWVK